MHQQERLRGSEPRELTDDELLDAKLPHGVARGGSLLFGLQESLSACEATHPKGRYRTIVADWRYMMRRWGGEDSIDQDRSLALQVNARVGHLGQIFNLIDDFGGTV